MIRYCNFYLPWQIFAALFLDTLLLAVAALSFLRMPAAHGTQFLAGLPILFSAPLQPATVVVVLLVLFLSVPVIYLCELYDFDAAHSASTILLRALRAVGAGVFLVTPFVWMASRMLGSALPQARSLEIILLVLAISLASYRGGADWLLDRLRPKQNILLVGNSPTIERLAATIVSRKGLPLRLRGVLIGADEQPVSPLLAASACGTYRDLPLLMKTMRIQRVAVCSTAAQKVHPSLLLELRRHGSHVDDALSMYEAMTGRVPVELLVDRNMSYGRALRESRFRGALYRLLGASGAALALLLASPLILVVSIAIRLDSHGPIFYLQERVGLGGKTFFVIKFRSMRTEAEAVSGPVWAEVGDPRITRVGNVLRKLRIDELPQFVNVLRGDMALVGPRPERPHFVSLLEKRIPYYGVRHGILPGITGWAQVYAGYGASVDESQEKLEYDLFYLKNRSPLLDMMVLLKTVKIVTCGKGAR